MTEPKKVAFSTLGSIKKEKKREKKKKSLRIVLTLAESNEKSCPEFNYRELLAHSLHERLGKKSLGEVINGPSLDPSDPFCPDEDAALKALAKKFETKYGTAAPNRKKRRKENDFSTLGEGYDESDPFIDNSDAFDEVVPTHLETKHRGFYINSGELDFETVPEVSSEEDTASSESEAQRRKKPNQIQSDEEEENEERVEEGAGKEEETMDEEEAYSKKRKLCENGFIRHKKRKLDEGELLRKRKKMIGQFNAKNQEKKDSDQEAEKPINGSESKGDVPPTEESIKASIEAVVSKAREEAGERREESEASQSSSSNSSSSDSDSSGSSTSSGSDSEEEGQEEEEPKGEENEEVNEEEEGEEVEVPSVSSDAQHPTNTEGNIPLPDNLPPDLTQVICRLKEEGDTCKGSSQKFFTESVNKLLLSIEMKLNKLGSRKKTQIYNHLSQHLPCGTQTIVKRAKNLLTERHESRLQEPLKRLRDAVETVMPPLVEKHALECQKAAESKGENGVTQNEDEENEEADKKKSRLPKKKFTFTEEIRKLLCDVVHVRVTFWQMIRKRSETPEEYIRLFLDTEVRPIWPKGWMNARILYKESQEAHSVITDKSYSKQMPAKRHISLGGGSVITSNPQPPRPSLSATVIPKNSPSSSSSTTTATKPKGEPAKRKSLAVEQKESGGAVKQPEERTASLCGGGLSIKSVEKINEGAPKTLREGEGAPETQEKQSESEGMPKDKLPVEGQPKNAPSSSVNVIDLSSDEEKSMVNKLSSAKLGSATSREKESNASDKEFAVPVSSAASVIQKANSANTESKKEDNLEEEMNLVMNEILQISKQKSVDDSFDRSGKVTGEASSVTAASVKQQSLSQSQEQYHHHQKQQDSWSCSSSEKKEQPLHSPVKHVQSSISPGKREHSPVSSGKPPQVSSSPIKQPQPLSSPIKQEQVSVTPVKQHNALPQQHSQPEKSASPHQHEHHTSQSSSADHPKHSTLPKQDKHLADHHTVLHHQKQASQHHATEQHQKHSPKLHSSSRHERQTAPHNLSLPPAEPKSPVQNQLHSHSSLQHHNPPQHTKQAQQQQQHSLQQSQHTQRQQPLSLQQPKQQQHPLNLQQPKAQHTPSYHHGSSQYSSLPQPRNTSPEPSRHKKQSQHYSQSHHQSQTHQKPASISSSWSSSDRAMISKTSPTGTSKTHSWTSNHEGSSSRQRQADAPIVSSADPLANLRMMHGLSVSSITKKTSASTSVYHSPAALATSSIGAYSTSGTKKSSASSSSSSSTSVKPSTSLAGHGGTPTGLISSSNKSNALSYTSSQSKHSAPSLAYSSASQHTNPAKARLDPYVASMSQSLYGSMTADQQLNAYKQLQQHQQTNHLTAHQQQELWQQMSSSGFLTNMSAMSSTDMFKLMSQMGKPMDSYTSASQPGPGQRHGQF